MSPPWSSLQVPNCVWEGHCVLQPLPKQEEQGEVALPAWLRGSEVPDRTGGHIPATHPWGAAGPWWPQGWQEWSREVVWVLLEHRGELQGCKAPGAELLLLKGSSAPLLEQLLSPSFCRL